MTNKNHDEVMTTKALDLNSPLPLHYQLREIIRFESLNGDLVDENGKIPTENDLIKRFQVSRITVRQALNTLVEQGFIYRERGKGTFLKTNQAENWSGKLMGFAETIHAAGWKPGAQVMAYGKVKKVTQNVQRKLLTSSVWELKRLRFADNIPIAIEHSYFPKRIGKMFEKQDLSSILVYKYIESQPNILLRNGKQFISAKNASLKEAEVLNISEGAALLSIERTIYSADQQPIEYLNAIYTPEYFTYLVDLSR
jgi:GntR family transcriptional regulator